MIPKIDGNNSYIYTNPKKVNLADTGEKFSLDYEKEGLQSEWKDTKGENEISDHKKSDQEKQQVAEQEGIKIELSSIGLEKQKQAETVGHDGGEESASLLGSVRIFLAAAIAMIKEVFSKIWNDTKPENIAVDSPDRAGDTEIAEAAEAAEIADLVEEADLAEAAETIDFAETTDPADTLKNTEKTMGDMDTSFMDRRDSDDEIRRHLQNGDVEQAIRLLTDNGRRTAARNSTLLTVYDKNGRVVKPDASVQQRTLYGDKNTQKL